MNEEMERMTWTEFLSRCDISEWNWTFPLEEEVVKETEDCWMVRIYLADILDQPDVFWLVEDGNLIIDWGIPVRIVDRDNIPNIFIRIWKTELHGQFFCDGLFYFDLNDIE